MKTPEFGRAVLVAFLLAVAAAAGIPVLVTFLGVHDGVRFAVALLAGGYLLSLIHRGEASVGLPSAIVCWLLASIALGFFAVDFPAYVAANTALIWLTRTLLIHRSISGAVFDAVISAAAFVTAALALDQTNSAFLAVWSFFLTQALLVWMPGPLSLRIARLKPEYNQAFARAERQAEAALDHLISR